MSAVEQAWSALTAHMKQTQTLGDVRALLNWDEQTALPKKGSEARGQQNAMIGKLVHERATDPRIGEWLAVLEGASDLSDLQRAGIRNIRRDYDRAVKLPGEWVHRMAVLTSESFAAWHEAKQSKDFQRFAPKLTEMLQLTRERASLLDPSAHPYEVLLADYDPGHQVQDLRETFARLRVGLGELLGAIGQAEPIPALKGQWDVDAQLRMQREVAAALGYDTDGGQIALSAHPFTIRMGPKDVRFTTHVFEDDLLHGLTGATHETGHALYEQGLPEAWRGTGVGEAASMGMHESQSRFWENTIGRSRAFCVWLAGVLRTHFPKDEWSPEALYRASNRVEPGLIRVAADEVTYNLHIILRFELELALIEGDLAVADLPAAWNERYQKDLGLLPPDDGAGVLQDVHWAHGAFGYFPSYTLGNLYAASFGAVLEQRRPALWGEVERGDFSGILGWLRAEVHQQGHLLDAPALHRKVVGDRDPVEDLLSYLWGRHGALYGVSR